MANKKEITSEKEKELCKFYINGASFSKIVNKFNISRIVIYRILNKNNIHIRNFSEASPHLSGKDHSMYGSHIIPKDETRQKMKDNHWDCSGKNNPMYGKRGELSPHWGKLWKWKEETKLKNAKIWIGRKHKPESIEKMKGNRPSMSGSNHPNWQGGISFDPYCEKWTSKLREEVRIRDGHVCQLCRMTQEENKRKLTCHHIHYDKQNCYPDLITLCRSCNAKVNFNQSHYESLFMNKLNERNLLFWTKTMIK